MSNGRRVCQIVQTEDTMQFNRDVMTELMEKECIIFLRNVILIRSYSGHSR